MAYEIYENGKQISISDEQMARIETILSDTVNATLTTKKLTEITELSFFIKDYQRGYRWTETEIEELLDDIESIDDTENGYCMQPLVVKKAESMKPEKSLSHSGLGNVSVIPQNNVYELLDGQQRLSTLWLILMTIKPQNKSFSVYYELYRKTDDHYIRKAVCSIQKWFGNNGYYLEQPSAKSEGHWKQDSIDTFCNKINKLFFIWYEVPSATSSEKVFKSINEGRTELTNAELFKAVLLNPDNLRENNSAEARRKLQQIAFEWDRIESSLRDDDFWYFLSTEDIEKTSEKTRIDFVIEIYARSLNQSNSLGLDKDKDRFSFLVILKYLKKNNSNSFKTIMSIWEEIVKVYDKLCSWYSDFELYHTIGFLVAAEEKNRGSKAVVSSIISEIYDKCNGKDVPATVSYVKQKIYKYLFGDKEETLLKCENLQYEYPPGEDELVTKKKLKNILLLTNIFALLKYNDDGKPAGESCSRFPFRMYHHPKKMGKENEEDSWDIEHIAPRKLDNDISACAGKDFVLFLSSIRLLQENVDDENARKKLKTYLDSQPNKNNYTEKPEYEACREAWRYYADAVNQNPDNRIRNLVLLNSSINRSYGNAFFSQKRKEIIKRDQAGVFIPICTKNVFLKYYHSNVADLAQWSDEDKEAYEKTIREMLKTIKGWK